MTNTDAAISPAAEAFTIQVQGIQSVMPLRPTDPRHARKVALKHPQTVGVFQKCHHILLHYKKASEQDSGWVLAGRLKESVGRALLEYPMVAGRLRWSNDQKMAGRSGELELVSNDSGIRLVEAKSPMSLDEFLVMKDREDAEGQLVFWEELNEQDPQFCPLAYIQVTNFECGGYSIGFSLSVALGDPLELADFLKHSAKLHKEMFRENKAPVFYLPKLKASKLLPEPNVAKTRKQPSQTLLYSLNARNSDNEDISDTSSLAVLKRFALSCVQDAERKLGISGGLEFALLVKDRETGDLTVEVGPEGGPMSPSPELKCTKWGDRDSGFAEITFWETHRPAGVAYWVGLRAGEGLVMVSSARGDAADVVVTIPHGK
uniref:Uncharacterized protein n=1 Tax=Kalanchoe fedtschenkoi TaxID=63787 RepID=A0A7N1A6S3_KALFE